MAKATKAARTIRGDLIGVTFVHVDGQPLMLKAGDTVPAGADVGSHLLSDDESKESKDTKAAGTSGTPKKPGARASRDAWAAWAAHLGLEYAEDATRDQIKEVVSAASTDEVPPADEPDGDGSDGDGN